MTNEDQTIIPVRATFNFESTHVPGTRQPGRPIPVSLRTLDARCTGCENEWTATLAPALTPGRHFWEGVGGIRIVCPSCGLQADIPNEVINSIA